jgi:hypothetical protein
MKIANISLIALSVLAAPMASADDTRCKRVRADLVEMFATEGCKPEHSSCFLGEVDGNNGLNGVTYFKGDSSGTPPSGSPDSLPYSGAFEYHTAKGSLFMRETGITVPGAVTAHQRIVEGTGDYAGATGFFFVSGLRGDGIVTTDITGEICYPHH